MAPTTLVGQVTTTSPYGRDPELCGYPLKVSEMLSQLNGPAYIARVSVHDVKHIREAKKAIVKAFKAQIRGQGLRNGGGAVHLPDQLGHVRLRRRSSGVEEKHDPLLPAGRVQGHHGGARKQWNSDNDSRFRRTGRFADGPAAWRRARWTRASCVSWLPSYGPEMRGGTANCSVVVADEPDRLPGSYRAGRGDNNEQALAYIV